MYPRTLSQLAKYDSLGRETELIAVKQDIIPHTQNLEGNLPVGWSFLKTKICQYYITSKCCKSRIYSLGVINIYDYRFFSTVATELMNMMRTVTFMIHRVSWNIL